MGISYFYKNMASLRLNMMMILVILWQCTNGVWSTNIYNEDLGDGLRYSVSPDSSEELLNNGFKSGNIHYSTNIHNEELADRLEYLYSHDSSEELNINFKSGDNQYYNSREAQGAYLHSPDSSEELNINFKSGDNQYYNSREAHGDIIDMIIHRRNASEYYYGNSDKTSNEETVDPIELFARILPGHDHKTTEIDLPKCTGRNKDKKQNPCKEEKNLCRSNGDCRIARIWGTCCLAPGCGSYCKPNRSKCPHPNSIKEACSESDYLCSPSRDDCPSGQICCQVLPCGYRCI